MNKSGVRRCLVAAYAVLWFGGVYSFAVQGRPPPRMAWTAPAFLFLVAAGILWPLPASERRVLGLAAAIGWGMEWIGVRWGIPFGSYTYTGILGPALGGVPLAIAAAWLIVAAGARQWVAAINFHRGTSPRANPWATALAVVAADCVIDPVAAGPLGFWKWAEPGAYYGVPAVNFAGWFFTGLAWAWIVRHVPLAPNIAVGRLYESVVAMFAVLAAIYGLWGAAALGGIHLACHFGCIERRAVPSK